MQQLPGGITTSIATHSALINHQTRRNHESGAGWNGPASYRQSKAPAGRSHQGVDLHQHGMSTNSPSPNIHPAGMTWTDQQQQDWWKQWAASDESKAHQKT